MLSAEDVFKKVLHSLTTTQLQLQKMAAVHPRGSKEREEFLEIEMGLEWTMNRIKSVIDLLEREKNVPPETES